MPYPSMHRLRALSAGGGGGGGGGVYQDLKGYARLPVAWDRHGSLVPKWTWPAVAWTRPLLSWLSSPGVLPSPPVRERNPPWSAPVSSEEELRWQRLVTFSLPG